MKLINNLKLLGELFFRKKIIKNYDHLFFRISELKTSIIIYEIDKIVLKDRIIEFEGLKKYVLVKIKKIDRILKI